jgi:hypothetical protein
MANLVDLRTSMPDEVVKRAGEHATAQGGVSEPQLTQDQGGVFWQCATKHGVYNFALEPNSADSADDRTAEEKSEMQITEIEMDQPLFDYCVLRNSNEPARQIAIFRLQEWNDAPARVHEMTKALRDVMKTFSVSDMELMKKWGGQSYINTPRKKQLYKAGVEAKLDTYTLGKKQYVRCEGSALEAELRAVVEAAGYSIIATWDNGSNSGHGFSIMFRTTPD